MESNRAKALVAVGSIALIVVLFVVFSGGDDESGTTDVAATSTTTTTSTEATTDEQNSGGGKQEPAGGGGSGPTIVITGGEPEGGVADLQFDKGDEIQFTVTGDVAEEVHVHGYDIMQDLEPGKPTTFEFPAEIDGVFEIELEDSATQIAQLTVNP